MTYPSTAHFEIPLERAFPPHKLQWLRGIRIDFSCEENEEHGELCHDTSVEDTAKRLWRVLSRCPKLRRLEWNRNWCTAGETSARCRGHQEARERRYWLNAKCIEKVIAWLRTRPVVRAAFDGM